ncbi:MAG: hypothetical protein DHS20C14_12500 [Phycisphaeraceae bacterium]|nr:MAG: hypothetical protein DHS20C14_12500 [Phycisphaeraceae bacterium]
MGDATRFDPSPLIDRMDTFARTLPAAVGGITAAEARWKPDDASWSIVEIVAHLADEETEDFRARVRNTLEDPARAWAPIDPEGWASERRYLDRKLSDELTRFAVARAESLAWLRSLPADAPWTNTREHPTAGPLSAGDLLASWCAHDALHLRQIAKRLYQLTQRDAGAFKTEYAGDWTA